MLLAHNSRRKVNRYRLVINGGFFLSFFFLFRYSFGRELVPYAQTILQLLRQIFTWTETVAENAVTLDGSKPFKKTRMQAYKSLSTWLTHSGVLSGLENVCEEFLSHILKDIVPEKNRIVLSVSIRCNFCILYVCKSIYLEYFLGTKNSQYV